MQKNLASVNEHAMVLFSFSVKRDFINSLSLFNFLVLH